MKTVIQIKIKMNDIEIINYINSLAKDEKINIWLEYMVHLNFQKYDFEIVKGNQFPVLGVSVKYNINYVRRKLLTVDEFICESNIKYIEYETGVHPNLGGIYYYYRNKLTRERYLKK